MKFQLAKSKSGTFIYALQQINNQPFYIVSAGRSGSTLLRRMLMAGSQVHIPPESDDFQVKIILEHLKNSKSSWLSQCGKIADIYDNSGLSQFWGIQRDQYYKFLIEAPLHHQNLYYKVWSLHQLHAKLHHAGNKVIADKTPLLVEWMPWLQLVNPNMKFVFLIRDVRDVVASRMKYFNETVEQAFHRYFTALKAALKFQKKHPQLIVFIRYEHLVYDCNNILPQICRHLGIQYSDAMSANSEQNLGDDHLPHHSEIHLPVSDRGIGRWKEQLNEESLRKINTLVETKRLEKTMVFFSINDVKNLS